MNRQLLNFRRRVRHQANREVERQHQLDAILDIVEGNFNENDNDQENDQENDNGDAAQGANFGNEVEDMDNANNAGIGLNEERVIEDGDGGDDPGDSDNENNGNDNDGDEERVEQVVGDIVFQNEEEKEAYAIEMIREWGLGPGVLSREKLDDILWRMKPLFRNMPLSHKTLLHITTVQGIINGDEWQYYYKGIRANLDSMDLDEYLERYGEISIDINMDGLSPFKRSPKKFWPILGNLNGSLNKPFKIAIHFGKKDPQDLEFFLRDFVAELADLFANGYWRNGRRYPFVVRDYILDAPARAMVKCCIGHCGYASCEKCTVWGRWVGERTTYLSLDDPLRTDDSFRNQDQPHHHTGVSPLLQVGTLMVSQFRLDPLHLVYEGAFKRLLLVWRKWRTPWKLHRNDIQRISDELEAIKGTCPFDFNRPPRTLKELAHFRGTEYRRLLLYDGILVFKATLDDHAYRHFLLLHSAIYILSSPQLLENMCDYANQLLRTFIQHGARMFGEKFVVYNIHALSHLASECENHGILESFSAFRYENHLKSMKQSLRTGYKPLEQLINRDKERTQNVPVLLPGRTVTLSKEVFDALEPLEGRHYKKVNVNGIILNTKRRNSCFKARNGDIVLLRNVVSIGNDIFLSGLKFRRQDDFYVYPIQSSLLGIVTVSQLERRRRAYPLNDLEAKCWLLPYRANYLCIPLYVVVKFTPDENEEISFDIGLSKWICHDFGDGQVSILWPPSLHHASAVKNMKEPGDEWEEYDVVVKRYYDDLLKARTGLNGFQENSAYETENDLGRGRRQKRKPKHFLSSDSDESDNDAPQCKKNTRVPSPPPVPLRLQNQKHSKVLETLNRIRSKKPELKKCSTNVVEELNSSVDSHFNTSTEDALVMEGDEASSSRSPPRPVTPVTPSQLSDHNENFQFKDASVSRSPEVFKSPAVPSCSSQKKSKNCATPEVLQFPDLSVSAIPSSARVNQNQHCGTPKVLQSPGNHTGKDLFKVATSIECVNRKVDTILLNQARLLRKFLPHEKRIEKPESLPSLPIRDAATMKEFENFLQNKLHFSATADYLSTYAANDEGASIRKMLKETISNTCAGLYSFCGEKDKKSFKETNLWQVLRGAILAHDKKANMTIVEEAAKGWLKNAPWRNQDDGTNRRLQDKTPRRSANSSIRSSVARSPRSSGSHRSSSRSHKSSSRSHRSHRRSSSHRSRHSSRR